MEERCGQIVLRQCDLPLGRSYLRPTWEGSRDGLVKVPRMTLRYILGHAPDVYPHSLTVDGIRLRFVGELTYDFIGDSATYARADGSNVLAWLWLVLSVRMQRVSQEIYYRVVLKLMVWGLARVPQGQRPSWRHIGRRKS
jgi:hypothetical protein